MATVDSVAYNWYPIATHNKYFSIPLPLSYYTHTKVFEVKFPIVENTEILSGDRKNNLYIFIKPQLLLT